MKLIDDKICVVTNIRANRYDTQTVLKAPRQFAFEGASLGKFERLDWWNLKRDEKLELKNTVKFTSCHSQATTTKPGFGYKCIVLMGRESLALYGHEVSAKDFKKKWIGKRLELENGQIAIVAHSAYDMGYWLINPTHKESEKGRNRFTHYCRTAYQIATDTLPLSTHTAIKFALNVEDVRQIVSHVQATKYAYYDVETFPNERNVEKEKRLEYNTTFFRARCRTLQISHQIGCAWVVPVYDFESPLNIGKDDHLEACILTTYTEGKGKAAKVCKIFTPVPDVKGIAEGVDIYIKKNGELISEYDREDLAFRREFAFALFDNWEYCKANKIDNYFKDLCFPLLNEGVFMDTAVQKGGHNVTFDTNVCRYPDNGLGFDVRGVLNDTMEQIHTLDKTKPMGLKPLSELFYPEFIGYGDDIDYENDHLYEIGVYGGTDTDLGARLDVFQMYELLGIPKLMTFYVNVKQPNIWFFADLEYNGCPIDKKKLQEVKAHTQKKANIFKDRLDTLPQVQQYVVNRIKKEREEALTIIQLKITEWYTKWLPKIEAQIKKIEESGKTFKTDGTPYADYAKALGKKAWVLKGIETGYWEPKSAFKYSRPIELQKEYKAVDTGEAEKAFLFDHSPSPSQLEKGKFFHVKGKVKYISQSKKDLFKGMNYNSNEHLGDFVYLSQHGLGFEMPTTTAKETDPETGRKRNVRKQRPTTSRKEITGLRKDDDSGFLETLLIYKALNYVLQSCVEVEEKLDKNGYIHTQFSYTNTDRSKSARPNLQNVMQRSEFKEVLECVKMYKSMFIVPGGDVATWVYYKRDLSQAELRWFCYVYTILSMAKAYDNNEDLHEKTTAFIMKMSVENFKKLPKDEYKRHRTNVGKGNNFGNIYGISAKGFQEYVRILFGYEISLEEAEQQQEAFFTLYPEIREAHRRQIAKIHKLGYSETPFGNRRQLPDLKSLVPYFQAEAERHGVNQPVQGAAGVAMMFSAVVFRVRRKIIGLAGGTTNLIHDDIPGIMRVDQAFRYQEELREACNNPPFQQYFGFTMDIARMKSDAEIGTNWKEVEELPDLIEDYQENVDPDFQVEENEDILKVLYPDQDDRFLKYYQRVKDSEYATAA